MQIQSVTPQKPRRISRKAIMHDSNPETLAPPTDRDPETRPIASRSPMLPPAGAALAELEPSAAVEARPAGASLPPSDFFERSYHQMVLVHDEQKKLHAAQLQRDKDLFDADGKFAGVIGGVMNRRLEAFEQKLEHRFSGIELKISKQGDNIVALELRIKEMEGGLATLRAEVDKLKEQRGTEAAPAAAAP